MNDRVKIFFTIQSADSNESETESLWASPTKHGYKLENIPFYVLGYSLYDVVSAEEIEGCLWAKNLLETSGHSTVRIWFANQKEVESTRDKLQSIGCSSEISDIPRLVAVDIPPDVAYSEVKQLLDEGVSRGKWDYQESCLGFL